MLNPKNAVKLKKDINPPRQGEQVHTSFGRGVVLRIIEYEEVFQGMELSGSPRSDIDRFTARVVHFLGSPNRYFECEIRIGEDIIRVDWSDWKPL